MPGNSKPRKPKKRPSPTVKVFADDLVRLDDEGQEYCPREGEWVLLKRRFKMKLLRVAGRLERLGEASDSVAELAEAFDELARLLAGQVVAWNWSDLEAEPDAEDNQPLLPLPSAEVLWELEQDELFWLMEKLMAATQAPKN